MKLHCHIQEPHTSKNEYWVLFVKCITRLIISIIALTNIKYNTIKFMKLVHFK